MQELKTFRQDEVLGPADPPLHALYTFQAPDRMRLEFENGTQTVWVGGIRYTRDRPDAPWRVEQLGFGMTVPSFVWEPVPKTDDPSVYIAPRIVGAASLEGVRTQILPIFLQQSGIPVWFRLWVDADGLVRRAEMRAQGHFMDHRYYDFDAPLSIEPPVS